MLPFSDEELIEPVESVLNKLRPSIMLDGGNITLVEIKNGKVFVELQGACKGCPSSNITLKNGVERTLKNDIHPELEVISIN
ncbi:MAG: NifU family protein [Helicobacteraceae bacterium]|nr:NifU family protein [Helicobacteraceae bacterium]